jgi:hypothetical protein
MEPEQTDTRSRQGRLDSRRLMVLEGRMGGATFRDLAEQLSVGLATVHNDYTQAIKKWITPLADEARDLEAARLDRLMFSRWQLALDGNDQALDRVLKIMTRRAKLLGLDEPRKIDITAMLERVAEEAGIDVEEALADADEIIRRAGL